MKKAYTKTTLEKIFNMDVEIKKIFNPDSNEYLIIDDRYNPRLDKKISIQQPVKKEK